MIRIHHKDLTPDRWRRLSFAEQMANVGSEIFRAISWRPKNAEYGRLALERALELLDLTLEVSAGSKSRLRELARLRETLVDYFVFENTYGSSDGTWASYFGAFNYAARNPSAKRT
jgi:hypothetical protein